MPHHTPWNTADGRPRSVDSLLVIVHVDDRFPGLLSVSQVTAVAAADPEKVTCAPQLADLFPQLRVWEPTAQQQGPDSFTPAVWITDSVDNEAMAAGPHRVISTEMPAGMSMVDAAAHMTRIRRHGPWESQQTLQSLVPYLVEECIELATVIEQQAAGEIPVTAVVDELGDVFLEVLFQAAVGEQLPEGASFSYDDVADTLLRKLRRRMPYAFDGHTFPATAEEQNAVWQQIKAQENSTARPQPSAAVVEAVRASVQRALQKLSLA